MKIDLIITGGDVYTPERIIPKGFVAISGGKISTCGRMQDIPDAPGVPRVDATGKIVAPGFVDIHIHGGGGGDFVDGLEEGVRATVRHHASRGTTSLLATTGSAAMAKIFKAFDMVIKVMKQPQDGAEILGIHMEGPYLSKPELGCHNADLIHDPTDPEELDRILSYVPPIKRLTLAPENPGALDFTRRLVERGVIVSGGHSVADYRQTRLAREAGMTHLTHHWSGMVNVKRVEAKRYTGMVEAGLVCDDITTEVISDGRHLPTSLVRLAYKCKGPKGLCLVSDSMRAAGMPEGVYEVCEMDAVVVDGVALTMDKKCFASSIITLDIAVRHTTRTVGIALQDVLRMATLTPAEIIGVQDRKGSLTPGKDADVIIMNPGNLVVEQVFLRGKRFS